MEGDKRREGASKNILADIKKIALEEANITVEKRKGEQGKKRLRKGEYSKR